MRTVKLMRYTANNDNYGDPFPKGESPIGDPKPMHTPFNLTLSRRAQHTPCPPPLSAAPGLDAAAAGS